MQFTVVLFLALASLFQQAPDVSRAASEAAALARIRSEKNLEARKKLAVDFEKQFSNSDYLPEVFMDLSRTLVSNLDFTPAKQYAEKAVSVVTRMRGEAAGSGSEEQKRRNWLTSMEADAKKNLAWVNQMIAWQQQQVRSSVLGKRN